MHEIGYWKKTIAPQLRFKRKVDKRFVNYSAEQLRNQLKDVIKPENDTSDDIDALLQAALFENNLLPIDEPSQTSQDVSPATHGIWQGPLDEHSFGVLIDATTLQVQGTKVRFCS